MASLDLGDEVVYALQTRNGGRPPEELYSTDNRSTADGLLGLARDSAACRRSRRRGQPATTGAHPWRSPI
ncbi:hypothetical protein [Rhizobium mayense]|uniref:hypothetical protein n=1 Tax=Rhizobium mayense TaxID=1312184 RepID=UPI00398C507D